MKDLHIVKTDYSCGPNVSNLLSHKDSLKGRLQRARINAYRTLVNRLGLSWTDGSIDRLTVDKSQYSSMQKVYLDRGEPGGRLVMTTDYRLLSLNRIEVEVKMIDQ